MSDITDVNFDDEITKVQEQPLPKGDKKPSFETLLQLTETSPYIKKVLGELDDQNLDIMRRLERLGDMFATELKPFGAEGKVLTPEENEYKRTLQEFKKSIELLYIEEAGKEMMITSEMIDRADREYDLGKEADTLEKGGELENPKAIAGVLERQNWGKIFTNLKEGDRVLNFMVPGADFLSIKYLNDVVMGPQNTNKIIRMKRDVIKKEMMDRFHGNAELIQNDYKLEIYKIPDDIALTDKQINKQLELAAKAVDAIMTAFVSKLAGDLIRQEREELKPFIIKRSEHQFKNNEEKIKNDEDIKKHEEKINILDQFNNDLHGRSDVSRGKKGFQMNYGLSEEIEGSEPKDKILGLTQSLQASRIAREVHDGYGAEYSEEKILHELGEIKKLRNELVDSVITDKDGNEFKVFSKKDGKFVLNRDLLRDVRKGKFKVQEDVLNSKIFKSVSLYVKKLNLLDAVKPFVFKDIETVSDKAEERKVLAKKIRVGENLSDDEREKTVDMLKSEEKAHDYTSKSEFTKLAVDMNGCAYVSLDVLDLGVDLLSEYESMLQEVDAVEDDKKMEKFNQMALEAGDITTEKLVGFRNDVVKICKSPEFRKFFGFKDDEGILIAAEVGGDELTLAINTDVDKGGMDEETLDKLLVALKKDTNSRVIKTVVAKSEKILLDDDATHEKKVEAHLQALKRAEKGATIAKDIEEAERKLNLLLEKYKENSAEGERLVKEKIGNLQGIFVLENGRVKQSVVVVEKEGVFKINKFKIANVNRNETMPVPDEQFDYASISGEINSILGKNAEGK